MSDALSGRDLEWAKNSPQLDEEHKKINAGIVRTRFPPEPNGYLHIGHAKSMNMNFSLAFSKLDVPMESRRTVFRYDDTNPEAESKEYIDSLKRDLEWLGWKPEKTTFSSDNFDFLESCAERLIKAGKAYVCFLNSVEVEAQRECCKKRIGAVSKGLDPDKEVGDAGGLYPGRYRDTGVEENLTRWNRMKKGFYKEGECTLRMKMDLTSSNPNMHDLMAYRIKYVSHPHAGPGRCVYPSYDFTHCICDSFERIDYSICTLEFETRREPYYWLLKELDMYRPKVYEMSRLNIEYTVLSKRRLLKLVEKTVRGWDDPRMPTISGLRRRGYTKECLNAFCDDVGATRNANLVEVNRLQQHARVALADKTRRCMGVLRPVKVVCKGAVKSVLKVPNYPQAPERGEHEVEFTPTFYVDERDVRAEADSNFFGYAPGNLVGIKYANIKVIVDSVGPNGVECHAVEEGKPKSYVTWVGEGGLRCEVREYGNLFTVPEPSSDWESEVNPNSEVICTDAMVDPSISELCDSKGLDKWTSNVSFQFERIGYYVVDDDTSWVHGQNKGKIVFNGIVGLKEDKAKATGGDQKKDGGGTKSGDAQRAKQAAAKARLEIPLKELFAKDPEWKGLYSRYDDDGIPTHDKEGAELKKNQIKKLKKDFEKHKKALAKKK
ncbi:hypothetical protein TrRE_jg6637 [Triparma retinervis]|uniref:glutamine--tRNA ligase n=1 Tax=Triparma retinervis TaxID=2557542 RepID=A0A9W7DLN8_9STRA|nr:hypothetical protein TrRE_jg6637 [Triparma retinervis]